MVERVSLTEERVRAQEPPATGEAYLWDSKVAGFGVRCFPTGSKVYVLMYRLAGLGRASPRRRLKIGTVGGISLAQARNIAQDHLGAIARGGDPVAESKIARRKQTSRIDAALVSYALHLEKRRVVNRDQVVASLTRWMPGPQASTDLSEIDRRTMAEAVAKIENQRVDETTMRRRALKSGLDTREPGRVSRKIGGPGAAKAFRSFASTFFSWAVSEGLVYANPLAGWRMPRKTRAEKTERSGKALSPVELKSLWTATADEIAFSRYVRLLILTGQRRTETSTMRWEDIDLAKGEWTIPATRAKNSRKHVVPLGPIAVGLLKGRSRPDGFVFAGKIEGTAMSGFSKRTAELVKSSGVDFTLHDLRRTFRSGLSALGVDMDLGEMMLNHVREDLIETYDREPRMNERRKAALAWEAHVSALGKGPDDGARQESADVISLAERRA